MNSIELRNYFTKNDRKMFTGVFAVDRLPQNFTLPASFIVNLSPQNSPGSHWISIYINKDKAGYYFDSFGVAPKIEHIIKFLKKHCTKIQYNPQQIQHLNSKKCGQFAAVYLKFRISGQSSDDFLRLFNKNLSLNDQIIHRYFSNLLR
jgi:hypothetical protein